MTTSTHLVRTRRFLPLFVTQLLGAFNGNLYKNAMVLYVVYSVYNSEAAEARFSAIASGLFILPFFLLSALAGHLADMRDKARIIRIVKAAEIAIMAVGAAGLMQLMPATARAVARRVGVALTPQTIDDLHTNLTLGTAYLRQRLDDFDGSALLAAAAYNAGVGAPRRWRAAGPVLEPAMWAETIPFGETRGYVRHVLSNAAIYAVVLRDEALALGSRLGPPIGPDPQPPTASASAHKPP